MSETMTVPPLGEATPKRTPTVYFIDDSATMREVIKIAFRRENINVITCADAASAESGIQRDTRGLDVRRGEQKRGGQSGFRKSRRIDSQAFSAPRIDCASEESS
jgi:DNA-binding NtrC family response regulator